MSAQNSITFILNSFLISLAVDDNTSWSLPLITKSTPSDANAFAQPLPKPLLEAHIIAFLLFTIV